MITCLYSPWDHSLYPRPTDLLLSTKRGCEQPSQGPGFKVFEYKEPFLTSSIFTDPYILVVVLLDLLAQETQETTLFSVLL